MNRRNGGLVALAGLLILGALGWQLARRPVAPLPAESPAGETTAAPQPPHAAPASALKAGLDLDAPLPPASAPLADTLPLLRARADSGDRRAACRLATELIRCQQAPLFPIDTEALEREYDAKGNYAAANQIAEQALWQREQVLRCRDVPAELADRGGDYLRQAALAGDASAMLAYAEGMHWRLDLRGLALDPRFDRWRAEAPQMARRAFEAGLPAANFHLSMAYQDDFSLLGSLVPNDPYRAHVHHLLMSRLFGWREPTGEMRNLSPGELQRALREADGLHQRLYGGRRFPSNEAMLQPLFAPPGPEAQPAPCDEERLP